MKTEAIHPFFSESTWPQVISSGNILPPMSYANVSDMLSERGISVYRSTCNERCNSDPHPTPEIRSRG